MLVDSNILIYSINRRSPKHKNAQKFLQDYLGNLEVAHQNILEAIRILTHTRFSHPMKLMDALEAVLSISESCRVISPNQNTYFLALELVKKYKLNGNRIFDAYLAATALSNDIDTIATDNIKHFQKFKELKIINPFG